MIGDAAQYRDLVTLYGTYGDEELIELARGMDDLIAMAQEVLKGELTRRRIPIPSPNAAKLPNSVKESDSEIDRFVDLAPQDCIWEFAEAEDALAASEALKAANIENSVILPRSDTLDIRPPRLAVSPEDVEKTEAILSKPIPEEFRILVRTRGEFVVPSCRKCGAPDPVLESIEPANEWRCEVCGHTWTEEIVSSAP
jgi:ribosomal protein S27E